MSAPVAITAAYAFVRLPKRKRAALHAALKAFGEERGMRGLVLIALEGINSTVCGSPEAIAEWKERLREIKDDIVFKDSAAEKLVFRRWSVKLKSELITLKQPGAEPKGAHHHLSPQEWNAMLKRDDVVVVDTRNAYEVALGKFKGAIDPKLNNFQEFPDAMRSANIPKDKKVLLYCTGGIRCEKAIFTMEALGYEHVYQLDGGILAYMEQCPDDAFEGECFVFDHRVAVDQQLRPSQIYKLCRECGNPTTEVACGTCVKNHGKSLTSVA